MILSDDEVQGLVAQWFDGGGVEFDRTETDPNIDLVVRESGLYFGLSQDLDRQRDARVSPIELRDDRPDKVGGEEGKERDPQGSFREVLYVVHGAARGLDALQRRNIVTSRTKRTAAPGEDEGPKAPAPGCRHLNNSTRRGVRADRRAVRDCADRRERAGRASD
jgi:hypothetical protein